LLSVLVRTARICFFSANHVLATDAAVAGVEAVAVSLSSVVFYEEAVLSRASALKHGWYPGLYVILIKLHWLKM